MAANEALDFDDVLIALAKKIPNDTMNELGKKLGFDAVEIDRYVATNSRYQNVTCNGTLAMLRDWDRKQTKATEQAALKKALTDAGLVRLADDFFPIGGRGDNSTMLPSSTVTQGTHVNRFGKKRVSDGEIIKLSKLMPRDNYSIFCVALGYDIAFSKNIVTKCQLNYSAAFEDILKKWSTETGGFILDLDEALVKAELGGLRDQYRM